MGLYDRGYMKADGDRPARGRPRYRDAGVRVAEWRGEMPTVLFVVIAAAPVAVGLAVALLTAGPAYPAWGVPWWGWAAVTAGLLGSGVLLEHAGGSRETRTAGAACGGVGGAVSLLVVLATFEIAPGDLMGPMGLHLRMPWWAATAWLGIGAGAYWGGRRWGWQSVMMYGVGAGLLGLGALLVNLPARG
ncbi:MAG TPA: hypothetical protein VEA69_25820 [Tepidisphaeraceae bacterium]|nr:hypothetical protein [Tepidisphaeraceae bacterium]